MRRLRIVEKQRFSKVTPRLDIFPAYSVIFLCIGGHVTRCVTEGNSPIGLVNVQEFLLGLIFYKFQGCVGLRYKRYKRYGHLWSIHFSRVEALEKEWFTYFNTSSLILRLKRLKILKMVRVELYHFSKYSLNLSFVEFQCTPLDEYFRNLRKLLLQEFRVFISCGSSLPSVAWFGKKWSCRKTCYG